MSLRASAAIGLLVLTLTPAAPSFAQNSAPGPATCREITEDAARLACYDTLFGHRSQSLQPPPAAGAMPAHASTPSSAAGSGLAADAALRRAKAAQAATSPLDNSSVLDDRWDLDGRRPGELFIPRSYKPVYLLPGAWTDRVNQQPFSPSPDRSVSNNLGLRSVEVKYQVSFKAKMWEEVLGTPGVLWAAYTQSSRWQLYSDSVSRPFRETNYEPEVMFGWPLKVDLPLGGWQLKQASLSLNHLSNGRSLPLSRSWNRIIGELRLENDEWTAELRPWWRLPESLADDDNPDIADHFGRGELLLTRRWGEHAVALQLRHSLRSGARSRGSAQLEWWVPLDGPLKLYLQWFNGYGESMVDYNIRQNKVGVGVSMIGWR